MYKFMLTATILVLMTSVTRVTIFGIMVYKGLVCAFRKTTIGGYQGVNGSGQDFYDNVETFSFYVEGTTLLGFVLLLCAWGAYDVTELLRWHLPRTKIFYPLLSLVMACMALEPFCMPVTTLIGVRRIFKLVGYEYELLMYLVGALFATHVSGKAVHDAIRRRGGSPRQRAVCIFAWRLFLFFCALHNFLFARYDAVMLVTTQHKREQVTNLELLVIAITTRSLLASCFYIKLFDWPHRERCARPVNALEEDVECGAVGTNTLSACDCQVQNAPSTDKRPGAHATVDGGVDCSEAIERAGFDSPTATTAIHPSTINAACSSPTSASGKRYGTFPVQD